MKYKTRKRISNVCLIIMCVFIAIGLLPYVIPVFSPEMNTQIYHASFLAAFVSAIAGIAFFPLKK